MTVSKMADNGSDDSDEIICLTVAACSGADGKLMLRIVLSSQGPEDLGVK